MSRSAETFFSDALERNAALPATPWLDGRRADAIKAFHAKGVPHRRIENWKYSDLNMVFLSFRHLLP